MNPWTDIIFPIIGWLVVAAGTLGVLAVIAFGLVWIVITLTKEAHRAYYGYY